VHGPPADVLAAYARAYAAARPAPGHAVVRVELEARATEWGFVPGRLTRAWAYDDQVPGPLIEARVGDVLEVHLVNRLPEPTTLHWHGLRVPAAMDGTDMAQHPIPPGGSFTYRFLLPDAGTFWYHPHSNEAVQLERGLYGALVVRGADEPVLDRERVLVLDDVTLDEDGQIEPPGGPRERRDGREGGTRLVDGTAEPELAMRAGQVERWRVVNAASARYVRLSLGGRPFRLLGTGGGLLEAPVTVTETLLIPGDRVDVAVGPFTEGDVLAVEALPYDRGMGAAATERFATVRVGPSAPSRASVPERLRVIPPLADGATAPTRTVRFGERGELAHGVDFLINDELHHRAEPVTVGELQVWDIVNDTGMDHPFHLHGFFFQVLERNGQPPAFRSWEDTVNVPARGRVRIAWVPDDRPGEWMYHCHILEHHEAGMMAHVAVVRRDETTDADEETTA
jgi:FtsP/CotA-like multicopper oxidase with cupredoxin domain